MLTLNLAAEIMENKRTVADARELYGDTAAVFVLGRDTPYAEQLLFDSPAGETGDPDESIVASDMVEQLKEKLNDLTDNGDVPQ